MPTDGWLGKLEGQANRPATNTPHPMDLQEPVMNDRSTTHPSEHSRPDWHTLPAAEVETQLQSGPDGLADGEAARRIEQYGPNRLAPPKRRGVLMRLLMQFHNILLYVMLGAAVITAILGHWVDTGVLLAAVVINAIIGFIQEGKAEAALDAIRAMLSPHATVVRGGDRRQIDAAELVPGDRVLLVSGDRVPADLRLVKVKELRVEEAALTGESLPVEKAPMRWRPTRRWAIATAWPIPARWWCSARRRASSSPPARRPSWARSTRCSPASRTWPRRCCARWIISAAGWPSPCWPPPPPPSSSARSGEVIRPPTCS